MLLTECQKCLCIFDTFCCILRIRILEDIRRTGKTCCHLTADSGVIVGCSQPVNIALIGLLLRRYKNTVVNIAVCNRTCNSHDLAAVIQKCGFHHIIRTAAQYVLQMIEAARLLIDARIQVLGERKTAHRKTDCQIELDVVASVMIAAVKINLAVAVRIDNRLRSAVQTADARLSVIGVTVAAPCQRTVGDAAAACIGIVKIQRHCKCLTVIRSVSGSDRRCKYVAGA